MGILSFLFGKEPEKTDPSVEMISLQRVKALMNAVDSRMAEFERRMQKLEGSYGAAIGAIQTERDELAAELEKRDQATAKAQDMQAQLAKTREAMPSVLDQLGFDEKQKAQAISAFSNPQVQATIEGFIKENFPNQEVSLEGLLGIAPIILGLLKSAGFTPNNARAGPVGQNTFSDYKGEWH